jgi:hypothetical protein
MTLQHVVEEYATFRKTLGERLRVNGQVLKAFCKAMGHGTALADVAPERVSSFLMGVGPLTASCMSSATPLSAFTGMRSAVDSSPILRYPWWCPNDLPHSSRIFTLPPNFRMYAMPPRTSKEESFSPQMVPGALDCVNTNLWHQSDGEVLQVVDLLVDLIGIEALPSLLQGVITNCKNLCVRTAAL